MQTVDYMEEGGVGVGARVAKQQEGDLSGVCLHPKLFKIPIFILQIIT